MPWTLALNIWSCTTLRGQFTPRERTSPLQTLNATPFIRLWNLPYQITHRIFAPLLLLGGLFVFSFPIFSPAETQVSIYLLGTAGCKSFSGFNGARFYLTFRYSYWGLARHHSGNGATHINCETFLVAIFNSRTTFKAGSVFSHGK